MNIEQEKIKFQKQYSEKQWFKLCSNAEFKEAWNSDKVITAGEIANRIVEGEDKNVKNARIRKRINNVLGDILFD